MMPISNSNNSYLDRVAHLTSTSGGANGRTHLGDDHVLHDTAVDRSPHDHHRVLRLRADHETALRIGPGTFRAVSVILIRFAARPARDRVLELVEDADVELVGRTLF